MTPHPAPAQPGTSRIIARPPARRFRGAVSSIAALLAATVLATPLRASAPSQAPTNLEVLVADFNHDGIPDVLIPSSTSPTATIAFGTLPYGTFSPVTKAVTTPSACVVPSQGSVPSQGAVAFGSVVAADFNGDGFSDLFFVCGTSTSGQTTISGVMLGNGDGTFRTPILLNASYANSGVADDFNHDGKMDLVLVSYPNGYSGSGIQNPALLFFAGNGDGTFAAPVISALGTSATFQPGQFVVSSPVAADVDGDGYPDIVLNSAYGYSPTNFNGATLSISVFGNKQDGTFGVLTSGTRLPDVTAAAGTYPAANDLKLLPGNFFGDLHPAFAVPDTGTNSGIFLIRNISTPGTFALGTATKSTYASLQNAATATFTGSGFTDLLVSNGASLNALINDGAGNLGGSGSNPVVFNSLSFASTNNLFAMADANGDGYSDVYTANFNNSTYLALNVNLVSGSATATTAPLAFPVGSTDITANWPGNLNYTGSSAGGTQTVTLTPAAVSLSSSANPSNSGGSVTFNASIIPSVQAGPIPTGTYQFLDGSAQIASGTLDGSSSSFTFTTSALTLGTHAIQAVYAGDSFYAPSTSSTLSQVVNSSTPTLTWNPSPITAGTPLSSTQLNAVATDANGNAIPGTYVYNPPAGTVLPVGSQVLNVTFTPVDQTASTTASRSTTILVLPANQAALTTNLLLNPGAELGLVAGAIPNWTPAGPGTPNLDSGTFDSGINPHTGSYDFVGYNGASDSLSQTVSLLTQGITAARIDSGSVAASLSFWEQGLNQGTPSDDASITLTFLDTSGSTISSVTTSEVDSHNGTWQNLTASYAVPVGTRSITYTMNFIRHSGSDLDGFVDDNSLILATIPTAAATATTLAITSGAAPVTTVPSGTAITLAATVLAGTAPVTPGQVSFCDSSLSCTGIHLLGTAQLTTAQFTNAGTATLTFIPGIGTHAYNAVFLGTTASGASSSAASPLIVTGLYSTSTTLAQGGSAGNYTLTATVTGTGSGSVPSGSVSFVDSTNTGTVLATVPVGSSVKALSFTTSASPSTGTGPIGVVPYDLNGDGRKDLVVNNASANTLSILLGNGDGSFTAAPTLATGQYPSSVAIGDFNGDGIPDIAVTNFRDGTLSVFLGQGGGSFTAAATPNTGTNSRTVTTADFNRDGKLDLAIGHDNSVTILLGNGDGTFNALAVGNPTGNGPNYGIATGDFNGDGNPDIAVTNAYENTVSILLGNGDGTFIAAAKPGIGSTPVSLAVGDLNGDGKLDLAVVAQGDNNVTILLGNGDGTFSSVSQPTVGTNPQGVSIGDLNGDGIPDLAVANQDSNTVSVLLGTGDGTFTLAASPATGSSPDRAAIADFNGDGIADIATSNVSAGGLSILLSQLTQTVTATATSIAPIGTGIHQVIASYPGDTLYAPSTSAPVALTAQQITPSLLWPPPAAITFGTPLSATQLNARALTSSQAPIPGTFTYTPAAGAILPLGINTLSVLFTPTDAVTYTTATTTIPITVLQATPTATLTISAAGSNVTTVSSGTVVSLTATLLAGITPITPGQVRFCDASAPYCTDIHLLGTAQLSSTGTATLKFVPSIGAHTYKAVFLGTSNAVSAASAAATLAVTGKYATTTTIAQSGSAGNYTLTSTITGLANPSASPTGTVSFVDTTNANAVLATATLGDGAKSVTFATSSSPTTGTGYLAVLVADLNGDGRPDLAVTNRNNNTVTSLLGNGNGTFTAGAVTPTGAMPQNMASGDFNGDGKTDLAIANVNDGTATILLGNGDGSFTAAAPLTTSGQPVGVAIADFNGDGKADLAVTTQGNNTLNIFLGNGDGTFTTSTSAPAIGTNAFVVVSGDFNNDGKADVAVSNFGSNTLTILLGNGDGTFTSAPTIATGNSPLEITTGDFNADGKLDLAVPNFSDNTVSILLGNGDGTFTSASTIATGTSPYSVAIGDFNGDNKLDLAIPNFRDNTVNVLLGKGDGTFTPTATTTVGGSPSFIAIGDFNGDGDTDLAIANQGNGPAIFLLLAQLNQTTTATATGISALGTGTHQVVATYAGDANFLTSTSATTALTGIAVPATLTWTPVVATIPYGTALGPQQLNAIATTPTGGALSGTFIYTPAVGTVLTAGPQTVRVVFTPTSTLYTSATATRTITVTQAAPTLAWATPAAIAQGTALSATQLNATATGVTGAALPGVFTYTPAAGTIPAAGTQTLSVLFTPTDTLDYTTATSTVRLTVTGLALTSITPNTAKLGDPATTITLTGTGFTTGSLAQVNGTRIATTYVNATTLTAIIPATNFAAIGTLAITVANPATSTVSSSLPFTVTAPTPSITLSGPTTTQPGTQPALALTIANPYPIPLTATFTLGFASSVSPAVDDPSIQFAAGGRTFTFTVPANSTTVPTIQLQAGTVAGTITIPLTLTAAGVNVTPTTLQPVIIVVPGSVPAVTTATITRSAASFTVTIHGFSNTREVATAGFHFTPATGAQIDTPDVTIPVTTIFSGWFTSAPSVPYGSTFTYTQVFNVSDTAANIGSVQVTLTNAVGVSTTYTAQ